MRAAATVLSLIGVLWSVPLAEVNGTLRLSLAGGGAINDLALDLSVYEGEVAQFAYAYPISISNATDIHRVAVSESKQSTTGYNVKVNIYTGVGAIEEELSLSLQVSGTTVSGTYTGTYWGMPVSGKASGAMLPYKSDYVPVASGEHPRLLFRESQLPWLRAKAETPQGRKMLEQMKTALALDRNGFGWGGWFNTPKTIAASYGEGQWAAGHALLWALYGDKEALARAKMIMIGAMTDRGSERLGPACAQRWAGVALTYDLCHDAWSKEFRDSVYQFLTELSYGQNAVYTPSKPQNRVAKFQAGGGMCALAMMNDPIAMPLEPIAPTKLTKTITPPANFTLGSGVPVVPFIRPAMANSSGNMPKNWLWIGGFTLKDPASDPLKSIGGTADARPYSGQQVTFEGVTFSWQPTSDEMTSQKYGYIYMRSPPNPAFDLYNAKNSCRPDFTYEYECFCWRYYYTVIDNEKDRAVIAKPNDAGNTYGVTMRIGGQRVNDNDVFILPKGKYPLMVGVPLTGGFYVAPMLLEYTDAVYQEMRKVWERITLESKTFGLTSGLGKLQAERRAAWCKGYALTDIKSDGTPDLSEGTLPASDMMWIMLPFAQSYYNVTGTSFAAGTGIPMLLPWVMTAKEWGGDYGHDFWRVLGFVDILPKEYRSKLKTRMDEQADYGVGWLPWNALFALINYPWDDPMPKPLPTNVESGGVPPAAIHQANMAGPDQFYDLAGRSLQKSKRETNRAISRSSLGMGIIITKESGKASSRTIPLVNLH